MDQLRLHGRPACAAESQQAIHVSHKNYSSEISRPRERHALTRRIHCHGHSGWLERRQRRFEGAREPRLRLQAASSFTGCSTGVRAAQQERSQVTRKSRGCILDHSLSSVEPAAPSALVWAPASLCALRRTVTMFLFKVLLAYNYVMPQGQCTLLTEDSKHAPLRRTTLTIGTPPLFLPRIRKRARASIACVTNSAARRLPTILPGFRGILAALAESPLPCPRETHRLIKRF